MPSDGGGHRRWLADILHNIDLAQEFLGRATYQELRGDTLRLYAIIRCLEIISEASRRLPDELKSRHPAILWREMGAAGNIYRHEYEDVDARLVWRTVTHALTSLRLVIEQELGA